MANWRKVFGSFRMQVLLSYLPLTLIFIIGIGVYQSVDEQKDELFLHLKQLEKIEKRFLDNHRLLQAFLLNGYRDSSFYDSNSQNNIDAFIKDQLYLQNSVRKLKFKFAEEDIDIQKGIDSLFVRNTAFVRSVEYMKALMLERGFGEYGMEGQMRGLARQLENEKLIPLNKLLMLRRYEQNFLMTGEESHVYEFAILFSEIESSLPPGSAARSTLTGYYDSFMNLVELDNKIGINGTRNAYANVLSEMDNLGSFYQYLIDDVSADINAHYLVQKRQLWVTALLLLVIAVLISIYLSKDLTRDIRILNRKLFSFVQSQFKSHPYSGFKPRNTEVANLNRDFERLMVELQTTLKRMEKEKRKAEETAQYKSLFLANMSHEIRTPLNGVIGMLHMMKNTRLSQKQKQYMEVVEYSANHLLELVNMILDHSKMDAKKMHLEKTEFDLAGDMLKLVKIFEFRSKEKGLDVNLIYEGNKSRMVIGDSLRLQQVLINLLNNGLKFTEEGHVDLHVKVLEEDEKRQRIRFEVEDTGIGIGEEQQKRLFQAFEQLDTSTTRKYGGTGLGLTISYQLVELMGGTLAVESRKDYGSRFSFELEMELGREKYVKPQNTSVTEVMSDIKYRVLLAEDNPVNQQVLKLMLTNTGASVTIANNGREAVEAFEKKDFDIILMDLQMPEMDGLEASRIINKSAKFIKTRIPIVAVTANAFSEDRSRAAAAGMDDFLTKPIKPEEFRGLLAKYAPGLVA